MPIKKSNDLNSISRAYSLELLVDYGINLQTKELLVCGDVNDRMFDEVQVGLQVLNQLKVKKLTLVLNTGGGDLYSALGIYDMIKYNKIPVDVKAIGLCMSAGAVILQAGKARMATPLTQMMVHFGDDFVGDDFKRVRRYIKHRDEVEFKIEKIFEERCSWDSEQYEAYHAIDTYFSADEALKHSLIDRIVTK